MAVSGARATVYTVLGLWMLALSGCAGVSTSPTANSTAPSASAACATP
ncbi:septal ring lytic transglycosylase RlpA family lipoprotein, partial [Acidithiobacillus ferrooxidans]|nr:septal ring lytic transglycosylase RlpA family lipoprotein [Acidithiobacillus ferrooxidans]